MIKYLTMLKRFCLILLSVAAWPLVGQVSSALPADRLLLANQLVKRGLYTEAIGEYEAIRTAKGIARDEVLFRLGEAYRSVKRPADALACYGELLATVPQSRYADYARLNRALLQTGAARQKELIELDRPGAADQLRAMALYYLGEIAEQAKRRDEAVGYYTRAAEISSTNEVARLARLKGAALRSASADPAERRQALGVYLDLAASKDIALVEEALYFAAMLSYREGRYAEAASLFRRLASEFSQSVRTMESRIYAAWANYLAGRYSESLEIASPMRAERNEDAYYITAASLRLLERRSDALAAYDAALKTFPKGRYADTEWFERLTVVASTRDHAGVLAMMAERKDPPAQNAERAWGFACESAIALTNFPLAVEYARLVAQNRTSPLAPNAVHRLAWLLEKTSDWGRAAVAYRGLAQSWPTNAIAAQALYQAGASEIKAGRPEQARADWTALLTRFPESPYACEALYARAMEEIRAKDFHAAERSLGERMKRFPSASRRSEAFYWWGIAARGAGDDQSAEQHFRDALAAEPTAAFEREIKLELAALLQKKGADQESAKLFAELLDTKAVDRLSPSDLAWVAESMLAVTNWSSALKAAQVIEARKIDAAWTQIGAFLAGSAHEALEERDAALAAYARALATGAQTVSGAKAALALGRLEMGGGQFDEAKAHLSDAVERSHSQELLHIRMQAYACLAKNEEERGDLSAALGYHMLVGTLFDNPEIVPQSLRKASDILRTQGKVKEADALAAELNKRYPAAAEK